MIGKALVVVSLLLTMAEGCSKPKEDGMDGAKPNGKCGVQYETRAAGKYIVWPDTIGSEVWAEAYFYCDAPVPPKKHSANVELQQYSKKGGWKAPKEASARNTSARIPTANARDTGVLVKALCAAGNWRVHVVVTFIDADGVQKKFTDDSWPRSLKCP